MANFVLNAAGELQYTVNEHTWIIKFDPDEEEYNCFDDNGNEEMFDNLDEALEWCREPVEDEDED
jgi:hypothetical protein